MTGGIGGSYIVLPLGFLQNLDKSPSTQKPNHSRPWARMENEGYMLRRRIARERKLAAMID
jgi:hypothetical protein